MNEFALRKTKEGFRKERRSIYKEPVNGWIFFTIPVLNLLFWLIFISVYYKFRKKVKNANNKKNR